MTYPHGSRPEIKKNLEQQIINVCENHLSSIKPEISSGDTLLTLELALKDLALSKEPKFTEYSMDRL
jgi:hypothetical protein